MRTVSGILFGALALGLVGCSSEPEVSGADSMESELAKAAKERGTKGEAWAPKGGGGMKADKSAPPKGAPTTGG